MHLKAKRQFKHSMVLITKVEHFAFAKQNLANQVSVHHAVKAAEEDTAAAVVVDTVVKAAVDTAAAKAAATVTKR
jgi:hypothetical protein